MDKKIWVSVVVAIFVILIGTAVYKSNQDVTVEDYTREDILEEENNRPTGTLNTKYQYKDGQHVYVASLEMPNPCYGYNWEVNRLEDSIELFINTVPTDEMCAQVITERLVKIAFNGEPEDVVVAYLNGELVNLNLFIVPEGEDIDDIEVFIKG